MTSTKFFKRAGIGAAFLAAISAASAMGLYGETLDAWKAAAERLQTVRWDMDSLVLAAQGSTDSVRLALLGLAFMAVLVGRNRGN